MQTNMKSRANKIIGVAIVIIICLSVFALLGNNNNDEKDGAEHTKKSSRWFPSEPPPTDPVARARWLQTQAPFIDGHNDLPNEYRILANDVLGDLDITVHRPGLETDIPRLLAGKLGAQFWSVFVNCSLPPNLYVQAQLEQIDVLYRMVSNYSDVFQLAFDAPGVYAAFENNKIASLMGMEGGHAINSSMGALRMFQKLGVRYMTLTHVCNTAWAQSANDAVQTGLGLTAFGREVVHEMNRAGILVDISHVAAQTMRDALNASRAPVIFSHSNTVQLCNNVRNAPNDVLLALKANGGVLMVVFVPQWICVNWGQAGNVSCNVSDLVNHIDYVKHYIGVDHVGVGSAFEGVHIEPVGLEDTSKFMNITTELIKRGYTDDEIIKVMGGNIMRVLAEAQAISLVLQETTPPSTTKLYGTL